MILQRFVHFTAKALQPITKIGPKCRYNKENADNPSADTAEALQLYQTADTMPPPPFLIFFLFPSSNLSFCGKGKNFVVTRNYIHMD